VKGTVKEKMKRFLEKNSEIELENKYKLAIKLNII